MQESTQNHKLLVYKDFQDIIVMQEINLFVNLIFSGQSPFILTLNLAFELKW